jgi:hypothetical protein
MEQSVELSSDVSRPKLMLKKEWSRTPNTKEAGLILQMEEEYIQARALFERYDVRAKNSYNQNPEPIAPNVYLKWLYTATYQYAMRNAEVDLNVRRNMKVQEAVFAGLGDIKTQPNHGEVPLTVGPYEWRVKGEDRGFVADGDRVHLHHTPAHGSISSVIDRNRAISVGIGDGIHKALHVMRDQRRPYETRFEQVEGDFDFIKRKMEARGYRGRQVEYAREKVHDLNDDLGLYRGGR